MAHAAQIAKSASLASPGSKEQQADKTRRAICDAAIGCLDEIGYADTSLTRIQERAGLSRGALTHHFPTKEDLIAATLDMLLGRSVMTGKRVERAAWRKVPDKDAQVRAHLKWLWERLVRTPEGRALMEILMASRTDKALGKRTAKSLIDWDARMGAAIIDVYESPDLDDADVVTLWAICRVFMRGMLVHERFTRNRAEETLIVDRFIALIAPHLKLR
ncbi:MAG: TetR/AcrR family transcriptional regulator [Candidatus Phaeomarinobacter sp.]